MQIINNLINKLVINKYINLAYIEKPINERYDNIYLHLIFVNEENYFQIIKKYLEEDSFLSYWDNSELNVYHYVSEDGLSLYVYRDIKVYNYSQKQILYNPCNVDLNSITFSIDDVDVANGIVNTITNIANELYNVHQFFYEEEVILAFNSLNKANEYLFLFLSDFYLFNPNNHSFNELIKVMPSDLIDKYKKIISVLKIDCIEECTKLLIWFLDNHIVNLPITIARNVDIDYYLYVKRLILKI